MSTNLEPLTPALAASEINGELRSYCKTQVKKARLQDVSYERLWQTIETYLQQGGKRIRPYLVLITYEAYGGAKRKDILPVAAAWELLHASLLIHDDIIDRDTTRHGSPNIVGVYEKFYKKFGNDTDHYADSAALLAGDLLLSGAHELVLKSNVSADDRLQACKYLNEALFSVGGGELLDVEVVLQDIATSKPEKIARYKTAQYSFEYPLLCGASLAGASPEEHKKLQDFGASIGVAFQLVDDLLGVFGNPDATGKPNNSDIRDKKRTLLAQETLKRLGEQDALYMETLYKHDYVLAISEVENIRQFMEESGARQFVEVIVNTLAHDALRIVDSLRITEESRQLLRDMVAAATKRIA